MTLDAGEWRYGRVVIERQIQAGDTVAALALAADYAHRFPGNSVLGTLYAQVMLAAGRNAEAVAWLDQLEVLPAEGSAEARSLFREANLLLAVERLGQGNPADALALAVKAREWPERLGAGKPYAPEVDERLEDWVAAEALVLLGRQAEAELLWRRIVAYHASAPSNSDLLTPLAQERLRLMPGVRGGQLPDLPASELVTRVLRLLRRIPAP